MKVEDIKM